MVPSIPAATSSEIFNRPAKLSLAEALSFARETRELVIGPGTLSRTAEIFRAQFPGAPAMVIGDPATLAIAGRQVETDLRNGGISVADAFIFSDPALFAEHHFVRDLVTALQAHNAVPLAVGSGTINDLVKLAAHLVGRPYLSIATAASMDGYTAFGASITYQGAKQTFNCPAPRAVIADTEIIRRAPAEMTASGYADLQAKITAGADWILADALGIEPIEPRAWSIVQGGLRDALADPAGARAGDPSAISALTEGLMLGGFAMQWSQSSRPASGAEHQFSHLWDMEHHVHRGKAPSHGFKVGLATLAVASLYEQLLQHPVDKLDLDQCCARWPDRKELEADIRVRFAGKDFVETAVQETLAKYVTGPELRLQLERLKSVWPKLREQLRAQLLPMQQLKRRLHAVGAPTEPEEIGISRERLRRSFQDAYFIRRRFTVLDLVVRTGTLDDCLIALFGTGGTWAKTS